MSLETGIAPPIPYTPLPRWSIGIHSVLAQRDDDVLLVRVGIWRRVVVLVFVGSIGSLCVPFLIALHSSLTIENYRLSPDIMPFAWASVPIVLGLLVLSIGVLLLSPIRFDRSTGGVGRGGWVPGWWQRDVKDMLAIQICRGKADVSHESRGVGTNIKPNYQLNLVFDDSPPTRHNIMEDRDRRKVVLAARQIADFLGKPILNYVGNRPGTHEKIDAEAHRLLAARRQSTIRSTVLCLISAGTLVACCGCPPQPPSQEAQRASIASRWITVEPTRTASGSKLSEKDTEAIIEQVPLVSELVSERVYSATIRSESSQAAGEISATGSSYLRFLEETTRAEVKKGRFLEPADSNEVAHVIVLDEQLADKLFSETDPIGRSVTIGHQTLTVIGVVTQPRSGRSGNLTSDAYLPCETFSDQPPGAIEKSTECLDRIRVRVEKLDQSENTKAILRELINKSYPEGTFIVR